MGNSPEDLDQLRAQVASLTARVYQLEQARDLGSGKSPQPVLETTQQPSPVTIPPRPTPVTGVPTSSSPPVEQPQQAPQFNPLSRPARREDGDLEKKIGQYWLNRIGIAAMLIGVSYFLKYAFENNWIGPAGRIAIGLIAGIALVLWSERFRAQNYLAFSYSLKAVGIGALYFSLWGAFQIYHLIPSSAAFVAMIIVTARHDRVGLQSRRRIAGQLRHDRRLCNAGIALHRRKS